MVFFCSFILYFCVHRYKQQGRIPGVRILLAILHWIWPPGRCHNCTSIYTVKLNDEGVASLGHIHRAADGRFILNEAIDEIDGVTCESSESKRNSCTGSQDTSSDDGGFLPKRFFSRDRASWRRPLVASPSQLSFRSDGSGQSHRPFGLFNFRGTRTTHLLRTVPELHSRPVTENLHINTVSANLPGMQYTPSRLSRVVASSPATSNSPALAVNSPWSPLYFSDLSSVHPSTGDRSFPTPQSLLLQQQQPPRRLFHHDRYINELPTIRALQEESNRMAHGFIPLHIPSGSPQIRSYYQNIPPLIHHHGYRPRSRLFQRYTRARSAPELASPILNLNLGPILNPIEISPESRSSSSGFGSKNTSSQQNQSSQSGGTNEWRYLPPYRPPPPPPTTYQYYQNNELPTPPYSMGHWLDLIARLNSASDKVSNAKKAIDVGSVDGAYEFDPATPTPSASTPTGVYQRDDIDTSFGVTTSNISVGGGGSGGGIQRKRVSRYDNIDVRVQAMKDEFYAFRKRQAMKRAGIELESAC
jgi:immunoglobulin superfamily member 9B